MIEKNTKGISRRSFLTNTALGIAGLTILPSFKGIKSPNDTINLGFIGMGQQAMYLLNSFLQIPGVQVVAGCDVYGVKRLRFQQRVNDFYAQAGKKFVVKTYENYQDLIARPDIDAVVIASPDHWHAFMAIDACKAGKDVYLEKPLTLTIKEGIELRQAVREHSRILAVGSQQRSDPSFQYAAKIIQEGKIGKVEKINAHVGDPPKPYDLPEEPIPYDLNWDLWLGPNPYVHYNAQLNPPISINPPENEKFWGGWRWYKELGGGFTTDWGAHMFDVTQWALGMDNSGPTEIIPAGYKDYKFLTYKYDSGVIVTEEKFHDEMKGVKFWGTDGWIEISRGFFDASNKKLIPKTDAKDNVGPYETKIPHQLNFIESIRSRKDPQVPIEIGHRSCTMCNLGNIAYELMRPVKWDPLHEMFVNDADAEKLFSREYRKGYSL